MLTPWVDGAWQRVAEAYASSIVVMMASPFILLAIIALLVVRSARKSMRAASESDAS